MSKLIVYKNIYENDQIYMLLKKMTYTFAWFMKFVMLGLSLYNYFFFESLWN